MKRYEMEEEGRKVKCIEFENIQEQKEYIKNCIEEKKWDIIDEIKNAENDRRRFKFFGSSTLEDTFKSLDYGLSSYTEYFLENINEAANTSEEDNGLYMDIEGFAYDMGSVVEGVPECCINAGMPLSVPIVKIMVDITFATYTEAKQIMNRGVAITNLINTLLAQKNIVELSFIDFNVQGDMNTFIKTNVDTTTLPIGTIAMICSPQFFRQISWITTDELRNKNSGWGRGRSEMLRCVHEQIKKENILFIGGSYTDTGCIEDGHYDSIKAANEYITKKFNDYCKKVA